MLLKDQPPMAVLAFCEVIECVILVFSEDIDWMDKEVKLFVSLHD